MLGAHAEALPAGHEELQVGAGREQAGDVRGSSDEVLEVVEQQQQPLAGDVLGEPLLCADCLRRALEHELWIADGGERDPVDAVRERVGGLRSRLEAEPRLAGAAGADEGQQANVIAGEERSHLIELVLTAEERCRRHGQVGAVEALQRRELLVADLVDPLGCRQILEPVLTEVVQARGADQHGRRGRHEHLPSVATGRDPGGTVHVLADVPLVGEQRRARVQADPHPDRPAVQRRDPRCGGRERSRRGREREEERVSLSVHLDAVLGRERLTESQPVLGEGLGIELGAELVQEPRRPFDIGEDEGHRPRRTLGP